MEIEGGGGGLWLPPEREFERFVAEFSRPERLEAELRRLLERFGVDPALRDVRFDPVAIGSALEAEADSGMAPGAPAEALAASKRRLIERLVTPEVRSQAERALAALGRRTRDLRDVLAVQVACSLLGADEGRVSVAAFPLWGGVLEASLFEWPLRAWIRERLVAAAHAEALRSPSPFERVGGEPGREPRRLPEGPADRREPEGPVPLAAIAAAFRRRLEEPGGALADLERFIAEDRRAAVIRAHAPAIGAPRILWRWLLARDDLIPEVRIPFECVFHGAQVEARLAAQGQGSFVIASEGGRAALPSGVSQAWTEALARDLERVAPVYRARCLEWVRQALGSRDEAHFEAAIGHILALDAPEAAVEHVGLFANYERSVREAASLAVAATERSEIAAVLASPLDERPYRLFVEGLRARGEERRAEVAEAALAELFPKAP